MFQIKNYFSKNTEVINLNALRKAKIVYNFGISECNRVNQTASTLLYCIVVVLRPR